MAPFKKKPPNSKKRAGSRNTSSRSSSAGPAKNAVVCINNKLIEFNLKMLETVRKLQQSSKDLIPKLSFSRLVREVTQDFGIETYRWSEEAFNALQFASEIYMTQLFEDSNKCAFHAKRVTIKPPDMNLVLNLRETK